MSLFAAYMICAIVGRALRTKKGMTELEKKASEYINDDKIKQGNLN